MLGETDISLHAMNRVFSALPSLGVGGCRAKGRECNGDTEGKEMFLLLLKKKKKKGESSIISLSCRILTIQTHRLGTSTCGTWLWFLLCYVAAMGPWTSHWASDSLNFLICKIGKVEGMVFENINTTLGAADRQIPSRLINLRVGGKTL